MGIDVCEEPIAALTGLARIPIVFEVERVIDVAERSDGFVLTERPLTTPYVKDYDGIDGNAPKNWPRLFDVSTWGLMSARIGGRHVGGVVIAFNTTGLSMLEDRCDLGVLWDIRVAPDCRGQGVGSALFRAAETWASTRGCRQLKIETQNINVPACRFYIRQGCVLRGVNRFAYRDFPDEVQLLWYKDLDQDVVREHTR